MSDERSGRYGGTMTKDELIWATAYATYFSLQFKARFDEGRGDAHKEERLEGFAEEAATIADLAVKHRPRDPEATVETD